jgi:hypothetical protein
MTETLTHHYRLPDGVLAMRSVTGMELPPLPKGAKPVTPEEYAEELQALQVQREEHRAQLAAEDQGRMQSDYDALRELGVPEATASRLTGYVEETDA